jgi:hypothetical protein
MDLPKDVRLAITLKTVETNSYRFINVSVKDEAGNVLMHTRKPLTVVEAMVTILEELTDGVQVRPKGSTEWVDKAKLRELA